jgi:hypothetical protein
MSEDPPEHAEKFYLDMFQRTEKYLVKQGSSHEAFVEASVALMSLALWVARQSPDPAAVGKLRQAWVELEQSEQN